MGIHGNVTITIKSLTEVRGNPVPQKRSYKWKTEVLYLKKR